MKERFRDLLLNPRIELIPTLLNVPIVVILLVLLHYDPSYLPIINEEAAQMFGAEINYVRILEVMTYSILFIILVNFSMMLLFREKVPIIFHILPIITIISTSWLIHIIIQTNDFMTPAYLFQVMGRQISLILYLATIIFWLGLCFLLLYGVPRLWNYFEINESSPQSKFRPRALSIITIFGFICAFYFILSLIFTASVSHSYLL